MPENNENNNEDIRDTQRDIMCQTVALSANVSNDSTLKVLDYILNASTNATAQEIAQNVGISTRSANRHLKKLKSRPATGRIFSHASHTGARPAR